MDITEFEFELTSPIEYHAGGEKAEANKLHLTAPTNKVRNEYAKLKQGFMHAFTEMQKNFVSKVGSEDVKSSDEPKPEDVVNIITMSQIDLNEYHDVFKKLLLNDICHTVDDGVKLTKPMYDQMSPADTEKLLGEYMINFIVSSLMMD